MSIGVAIIGSGIFAKEQHLPAVKACSHLILKAIYSRSLKSAQTLSEQAGSVDLYSNDSGSGKTYHDLLLRSDIQAVIIALPIMNQPEYIEAALAAGKHVLSEKPIAENLKRAEQLIEYYKRHSAKSSVTWSIAENYRFLDQWIYGKSQVEKLGPILGFRMKVFSNTKEGGKYFETDWRKTPSHQGGFLLDGGVHFVAGLRYLLGPETLTGLSAYSTLLKKHLPPVDTINSILITKSGISGTLSVSFGTTFSGLECAIACENGTVTITMPKVTVTEGEEKDGKVTEKQYPGLSYGVTEEVQAWGEGLVTGKQDKRQTPEEALADLEVLEKILVSGEAKGSQQVLNLQL